jgi:hypothetical protein
MDIHIVTAEHFNVRGLIMRAFKSKSGAEMEFIEIVKTMANYAPNLKLSPIVDFPSAVETLDRLQDYHGDDECYVKITSIELRE